MPTGPELNAAYASIVAEEKVEAGWKRQFEEWARAHWYPLEFSDGSLWKKDEDGDYENPETNWAWCAWREATRRALNKP